MEADDATLRGEGGIAGAFAEADALVAFKRFHPAKAQRGWTFKAKLHWQVCVPILQNIVVIVGDLGRKVWPGAGKHAVFRTPLVAQVLRDFTNVCADKEAKIVAGKGRIAILIGSRRVETAANVAQVGIDGVAASQRSTVAGEDATLHELPGKDPVGAELEARID